MPSGSARRGGVPIARPGPAELSDGRMLRTTSGSSGIGPVRRLAGSLGPGPAMALTSALSAGVGLVSWLIAARIMPQAEFGTAAAFVSAFLLVAGCSELNLGVGLMRWLPRAGSRAGLVALRCACAVAILSALIAGAYLLLPGSEIILEAAARAAGGPVGAVVVFVVACVAWSVFYQQDFVLAGLGRPWWAPARMTVFAVGRISIIVGFGSALTVGAIVWSWLVPALVCVLLAAVLTAWFSRSRSGHGQAAGELPGRRAVVGFLGPAYAGQLGTAVMLNQVPLLVIFRFGPDEGAAFFLAWQAVTVIDVAAQYYAYSMAATVASEPDRSAEIVAATRRRMLALFLPALVVGVLLAGPVLSVFGPAYARESLVLQVMLVGMAFRLLVVHRLGEHQALGRSVRFARLSLATMASVLGAVLLVPGDLAARLTGVDEFGALLTIAGSYVVVQLVWAAVVTLSGWRRRRRTPTARDTDGPHGATGTVAPVDA